MGIAIELEELLPKREAQSPSRGLVVVKSTPDSGVNETRRHYVRVRLH